MPKIPMQVAVPVAALVALSPAVRADPVAAANPVAALSKPDLQLHAAGERPFSAGVLVGASLPRPASVEVLVKLFNVVGLGASYSFMPHQLSQSLLSAASVKDAAVDASAFDAEARVFPFAGSFFLGAAVGKQQVSISVAGTGQGRSTLDIGTSYVTPRMGWLATWGPGFSLGFDLGVQLALSTELKASGPQAGSSVIDTARQLAGTPLPSMNFRLGWML